jgi:hypothetical protein
MATKKTIKENPITTFRKNFENRSKIVKASLKKAQKGMAVYKPTMKTYEGPLTEEATKILDARYPSTATQIPFAPKEANLIRGFNPFINGKEISNEERELMDRSRDENKMKKPGYIGPGSRKQGGPVYKKGGATKAAKFAALAPPYNKATAADRIAGAKKNARKKK